jgi:hypothetical protein
MRFQQRISAQEAQEALRMRLRGATYQEIADRFGYASRVSTYGLILRVVGDDEELRKALGKVDGRGRRRGRRFLDSSGYVCVWAPGHPVADKYGRASEHRVVLFDAIGPGPHPCAECGRPVDWPQLSVDHVNRDRTDNRPENLQPCHVGCNTMRARRPWRPGVDYPAWMDDPSCPPDFDGWEPAA